jgi:hypothetical protein
MFYARRVSQFSSGSSGIAVKIDFANVYSMILNTQGDITEQAETFSGKGSQFEKTSLKRS